MSCTLLVTESNWICVSLEESRVRFWFTFSLTLSPDGLGIQAVLTLWPLNSSDLKSSPLNVGQTPVLNLVLRLNGTMRMGVDVNRGCMTVRLFSTHFILSWLRSLIESKQIWNKFQRSYCLTEMLILAQPAFVLPSVKTRKSHKVVLLPQTWPSPCGQWLTFQSTFCLKWPDNQWALLS